jgi:7-keto-8-aminopelargonate synthetase-like enzyme
MEDRMRHALDQRRRKGTLRRLPAAANNNNNGSTRMIDISTHDYLGLASDTSQRALVEKTYQTYLKRCSTSSGATATLGATRSRSLSGDIEFTL